MDSVNSLKTSQSAKPVEVRGVFSTQEVRRVGTGTTTRKTVQKTFWFVEQKGHEIECQPLNSNYIPSGAKRKISMEELIAKFAPEPEFYMNSVYPKMQELNRTVRSADSNRESGNNFTAEYEYGRALKIDEENVRANFGIGLTYLERGDSAKAQDIFERLVKLDGAFQPEHKHLFNEFGINLRKNKMLVQALAYYQRAQELSPNDENLHMNIARVLLEMQNIESCVDHLLKALSLDPHHAPSLKFVAWLIKKNMVPEGRKADILAAIEASKAPASKPHTVAHPPAPTPEAVPQPAPEVVQQAAQPAAVAPAPAPRAASPVTKELAPARAIVPAPVLSSVPAVPETPVPADASPEVSPAPAPAAAAAVPPSAPLKEETKEEAASDEDNPFAAFDGIF